MIIVTPPVGSVPEPRPQALITGDRAVTLLSDSGVTTTALTKAGVQLVTVSLAVYDELTSALADEGPNPVDPATGLIAESYLPARLSAAAIAALNLIDPLSGDVSETYIPSRLSAGNLTTLIQQTNATQLATDPDGTPVVLGGGDNNATNWTVTGTVTANTATAGTLHGDAFTANIATIGHNEVTDETFDNQSAIPGAPAVGKLKVYSDGNGRLNGIDPTATTFLIGHKRIVTSWPADADSQLGDEAILSSTGEHRVYQGVGRGWRLASEHVVSSLAERDAITNKYAGMRVYCAYGQDQDQVWRADNQWHGTKSFMVNGGAVRSVTGVNDTNLRRWNETPINDPGYPYFVQGRIGMEVVLLGWQFRPFVWVSMCDQTTGANNQTIFSTWRDAHNALNQYCNTWNRFDIPVLTPSPQTGNRLLCVDWQCTSNNCNAYSSTSWAWCDFLVVPA